MANLRVDKITSTETFETTGSVQFDGANDHLDVGSAGDFNYLHDNTGTWTAEFWVCPQVVNSRQTIFSTGGNSSSTGFCLRIMASGSAGSSNGYLVGAQTSKSSDGNYLYWDSESTTLSANTWYHIATVYDNTDETLKIYVDGKLTNSGFSRTYGNFGSHSTNNSTYALNVGQEPYGNTMHLKGHLSNLRILNGVKLYTSNFKPPMRELEVIPGTTLLTCQSKTSATLDASGSHTITSNGGPPANELTPGLLTPVPKAGAGSAITGSVEFTGDPAKLEATSTDFAMGDSDLTMECWFYNGVDTITHMVQIDVDGGATNFSLATRDAAAGDVRFLVRNDSGSNLSDLVAGAGSATINMWHHLAATIEGTTTRLFLNGVLIKSGTISGTRTHTGEKLTLGANVANRYLKGYLSNVRIVKGTALYTDDFIPPTRELKRVPGTVLLCCQDPDSALTEATGKTITGYGDLHEATDVEMLTNGSFAGGYSTEWEAKNNANLSHSDGELTVTSTQNYSGVRVKSAYLPSLVAGRQYVMTIDLKSVTNTIRFGVVSGLTVDNISTAGRHSGIFTASAVTEVFIEKPTGSNSTFVLKSVSIRELNTPNRASNFTPQVGDDRKVTFEGVTKINTDAYFYLPTGDTASRETTGTYNAGTRGINMGGAPSPSTARSEIIDYVTIASTGDSIDFGDLTVARSLLAACADSTRGIAAGGYDEPVSSPGYLDVIDYVTIATRGNALDHGDLTVARNGLSGTSNSVRGVFGGGSKPPSDTKEDTIDYTTIASKGQAQDFGNLSSTKRNTGCTGSQTRGIWGGGTPDGSTLLNTMDYVTIASTGHAEDFGDITGIKRRHTIGASSNIRGLFAGGTTPTLQNAIDFITMSSMGNSSDFGDLTDARAEMGGVSSKIRAVFMGGWDSPAYDTVIDFVQIATTGNAVSFGSLGGGNRGASAGTSNGHGGLG